MFSCWYRTQLNTTKIWLNAFKFTLHSNHKKKRTLEYIFYSKLFNIVHYSYDCKMNMNLMRTKKRNSILQFLYRVQINYSFIQVNHLILFPFPLFNPRRTYITINVSFRFIPSPNTTKLTFVAFPTNFLLI